MFSRAVLFHMPLPIPAEINALATLHRQRRYAVHLLAIRLAAVIFPPRAFLSITQKVRTSNVMVDADFGAAQAGEIFFSLIGASAVQRVSLYTSVNPTMNDCH
jgi:hypothetical protein